MSDDAQTQPMLETLIRELREFRAHVEIRLDRIESEVKLVHSEMLTLRADFNEFKSQFKQPA